MARPTVEDKLEQDVAQGRITLVLGAGVSLCSGIPLWPELVTRFWSKTMGKPAPWAIDENFLKAAKEALQKTKLDKQSIDLLTTNRPETTPFGLQLAMEAIEERIRKTLGASATPDAVNEAFAKALRAELYANIAPAGNVSLETISEVLEQDQASDDRKILRVVTFNVDDLLELRANRHGDHPVLWPISRASGHPRRVGGFGGRPPIPVYHVHGYLPRRPARRTEEARDVLCFTDAQYWRSVAAPMSFPNRTIAHALHDSHCIFIGLSMTDVNLMRWLGVRFNEVVDDKAAHYLSSKNPNPRRLRDAQRRALSRHYWITDRSWDRFDFVPNHLGHRGVRTVELKSWGAPFAELMKRTFGLA